MTTPIAVHRSKAGTRRPHDAAGWLGLAASPTFALMAWMGLGYTPRIAICSPVSAMLPIDGMALMYLLMGLFHLSPWLKLVSSHGDNSPAN